MPDLPGQPPTTGQPPPAAPAAAADPQGTDALLPGGLTPQVEAVLAKLPQPEAELVRADIAQRNAHLTKSQQKLAVQRQHLERDVRQAETLRQCLADPEFAAYIEAREKGTLGEYYRQRAGLAGNGAQARADDNRASTGDPPVSGEGHRQAAPDPISSRLEAIERTVRTSAAEREIAGFTAAYPDYEEYLPAMTAARSRNPKAPLEDLYWVARGMVERGVAQKAAPATSSVAALQVPAATAAAAGNPPPAVGGRPAGSTPASRPVRSVAEAFAKAKADLGLPTDRELTFDLTTGAF